MTDELDALKAALKAIPAPDPDAKDAALRLAMENFDRLQGSTDATRLSQDRPNAAGFLNGVRRMLKTMTTRPALAATTSVAALCIGLFVAWPQLQQSWQPPLVKPKVATQAITPPAPPAQGPALAGKDDAKALGQGETAVATNTATPVTPTVPQADQPATTIATVPNPVHSNTVAPAKTPAPDTTATEQDATSLDKLAEAPATGLAAKQAPIFEKPTLAPKTSAGLAYSEPQPAPPAAALRGFAANQTASLQNAPTVAGTVAPADQGLADQSVLQPQPNTEAFSTAVPNPVHVTAEEPVSTFSVDVDTASYSVIRSSLNAGQLPPPEAVRIEEMVNYFPYNYPAPEAGGAPFTDTVTVMPTPWNPNTSLVHIALQGRMPATQDRKPLNLVFLIDTSGSMEDANKLPLLKQSFALMLPKLRPEDQIAIVAYAGNAGEVLAPTSATNRRAILGAINNLEAGGSTAGAEGLALAYQVAGQMPHDGRISRVILATDGDFNVGIDNPDDLKTFVAKEREGGTYLSVLGFGRGNLDDATMQALAQNGNGTASYIDTLAEAQKVLVDQLTGALFPIADDVKIQVEWNPAQVAEYRLIGYETRALKREDFNNDKVDAGEIGAGLQVTALYEVTAPGSPALLNDPLRYGTHTETTGSNELGFLRLRYKDPGQSVSKLIETPILPHGEASDDARFAAAIAGFGQLLQHSTYLGNWGWDQAIALATSARGPDQFGYRIEAVNLMRLAQSLSAP